MPEDSRKSQPKKNKSDPKEQRKPRQQRQGNHHTVASEKKDEKKLNEVKVPEKSVYVEPGPEFYQNLKRETDEILKITEEANTKYKKKEIQSNWSKYEMPLESYDDIEEQENMGADYEKLIQMPLSIGGHFQFKHEKSWDIETGPSPYDKYFEINMDILPLAIQTIPFYERNNIDRSIFSDTEIANMNNRCTRYKQRYYNDKKFKNVEMEIEEKITNSLKIESDINEDIEIKHKEIIKTEDTMDLIQNNPVKSKKLDHVIEDNITINNDSPVGVQNDTNIKPAKQSILNSNSNLNFGLNEEAHKDNSIIDDFVFGNTKEVEPVLPIEVLEKKHDLVSNRKPSEKEPVDSETKKPVIESPEDLEKWLDDFLDS